MHLLRSRQGPTRDDVPPKLFLAEPYPATYVTVSACYDCNRSFQANDEYTRYMAVTDMRSLKNFHAQSKLPAIIKSLQRTAATGFTTYLRNQTEYTRLLNFDGRPMGTSVELDSKRASDDGRADGPCVYVRRNRRAAPRPPPLSVLAVGLASLRMSPLSSSLPGCIPAARMVETRNSVGHSATWWVSCHRMLRSGCSCYTTILFGSLRWRQTQCDPAFASSRFAAVTRTLGSG